MTEERRIEEGKRRIQTEERAYLEWLTSNSEWWHRIDAMMKSEIDAQAKQKEGMNNDSHE